MLTMTFKLVLSQKFLIYYLRHYNDECGILFLQALLGSLLLFPLLRKVIQ